MKNIFKIASLLAAAVMLFSCEKEGGETNSGRLHMISDKDVIQANGQDGASIKVMLDGKDVTAESFIYDENDNEVALVDGKFTTSEVGEYKFYANYGTLSTFNKSADDNGLFVVKAINVPVPAAPVDTKPENTSFVHRTFLTQYTGTGCGNCPLMIRVLKGLIKEGVIPNKAVMAASHAYNTSDPAYIPTPKTNNYPFLTLDHVQGFSAGLTTTSDDLKAIVEERIADPAKAGVSVSPAYYDEEGTLVVKVSVKAAVDGIFNVGAWLLEDGIYGAQEDYHGIKDDSYDIHENCIRIADSKYQGTWFGHELGTLAAGQVAEKTFVMNVKKSWVVENLHLAVFVSYGEVDGSRVVYTVCNAVDAPIDAPTPFEYAK